MTANAMSLAAGIEGPARTRGRAEAGLSIIVPVFNEAGNLATLHARIAEVAKRLRVDTTTVRRWISIGALDAVILPHRGKRQAYRIRERTLDKLLQSSSPSGN